jgi:hypothetical protein
MNKDGSVIASECSMNKDGSVIASECAKLLQSALVEKPATCSDNQVPKKKPLCDIQNSLVFDTYFNFNDFAEICLQS